MKPRTLGGSQVWMWLSKIKELITKNDFSLSHNTYSIIIKRNKSQCTCAFEKEKNRRLQKKSYVFRDWEITLYQPCKCALIFGLSFLLHFYLQINQWPLSSVHVHHTTNCSQHTNTQILTRCLLSKLTKYYQTFTSA